MYTRLTAHRNDCRKEREGANLPESAIGPSFRARARSGGATGLGGRAKRVARPVKKKSHLISDAWMGAKYGRTQEIFDRSPPYQHRRPLAALAAFAVVRVSVALANAGLTASKRTHTCAFRQTFLRY